MHACAIQTASKETCLSMGTGSAFSEGEFAKNGFNGCLNIDEEREREGERKRERERERGREKGRKREREREKE